MDQVMAARQELIKLERDFAPDMVHIHGFGPSLFFYLETTNAHPAPLLVTLINELSGLAGKHELLGRVLRSADWVTGKATTVVAQACELVPEIIPRSSVIHNGC